MPFARWKVRSGIAAAICIAGLAVLVCSQHRVRLIFGSFIEMDSVAQFDANPNLVSQMRFMPGATFASSSKYGFSEAAAVLAEFNERYPSQPGDDLAAVDNPDSCTLFLERGRKLHCYNVDICASQILAEHGIRARMWDINGPTELGGFGHNLIEVFDGPSHSWRALDPYYHCYFTLGADSAPLTFAALRLALLTLQPSIHVVRYFHTSVERPEFNILAELRYLAPCAMLHANNDFRWRFEHRYGFLSPISGLIDRLPMRLTRGVRTVMLGSEDARFIIQDRFSPHFPITLLKWSFWTLALLSLLSLVFFIVALRHSPIRRNGP